MTTPVDKHYNDGRMKAVFASLYRLCLYTPMIKPLLMICLCRGNIGYGETPPLFDPGGMSVEITKTLISDKNAFRMGCLPQQFLGNIFYASQDQPAQIVFTFANPGSIDFSDLVGIIEMPAAFRLIGVSGDFPYEQESFEREGVAFVRYRFDLTGLPVSSEYSIFNPLNLLVQTGEEAGPNKWDCFYRAEYRVKGAEVPTGTVTKSIALRVLPTISALRPKRFETGAHFIENLTCLLPKGDASREFAEFYAETGCNAAVCHLGAVIDELGNVNVKRYWQPPWLKNGCQVGNISRPEDVRFKLMDGSYHSVAICPTAIYGESEYFTNDVVGALRTVLVKDRDADVIISNWEPAMYHKIGCYCDRCKAGFANHAGLSLADDVEPYWPDSITKKHTELMHKFRNWQTARVAVSLENKISEMASSAGFESHFVPEIWTPEYTHQLDETPPYAPYVEMGDELPWLNAWGPYPCHRLSEEGSGYKYIPGYNLLTYLMAKDAINVIQTKMPVNKRPKKLIAFPHGIQGTTWVTEPESMVMDIYSFFISGWDAAIIYAFPKGYDARYWQALAGANKVISTFEDYIFDGVSTSNHTVTALTPLPEPSHSYIFENSYGNWRACVERWPNLSIVQSSEYQLGDQHFIAVANYWQRGECFFRLSFTGLMEGQKYILSEPMAGRCYVDDKGQVALSHSTLKKGLILHAGAQRFVFFVLKPYTQGANMDTKVRPSDVKQAMQNRSPVINEAIQREPVK